MSPKYSSLDLNDILESTELVGFGDLYRGKVRDSYIQGKQRYIVTTDRLSCFDKNITTIPYKGQVLQKLALWWFKKTDSICPNHIIAVPDPNVMIVKECKVIPIEVVVRGYLVGSAWRSYQKSELVSGIKIDNGLKEFSKLSTPIITPTTKAEIGDHDMPISDEDVRNKKIADPAIWEDIKKRTLELFNLGVKVAEDHGLILVDTKYEFGIYEGALHLVDEIHTLDSSRYWTKESYDKYLKTGETPEMLDKEPVRRWLMERGFSGEGKIPEISDEYRIDLMHHYINSVEKIIGEKFEPVRGEPLKRILKNLSSVK